MPFLRLRGLTTLDCSTRTRLDPSRRALLARPAQFSSFTGPLSYTELLGTSPFLTFFFISTRICTVHLRDIHLSLPAADLEHNTTRLLPRLRITHRSSLLSRRTVAGPALDPPSWIRTYRTFHLHLTSVPCSRGALPLLGTTALYPTHIRDRVPRPPHLGFAAVLLSCVPVIKGFVLASRVPYTGSTPLDLNPASAPASFSHGGQNPDV